MVRPAYIDRNGTKKGAWSEEEDNKLKAYIQRHRHWNWRLLPKYAGLARCGKSCRLRWMNYLRPGLTRGKFTKEEGDLFIRLHAQFGNKWSAIAAKMPGRTDNAIKNYWHAHIKKRIQRSGRVTRVMKAQMPQEKQSSEIDYSTTDHQEEPAASMNVSLQGLSTGNPENIDVLNSITDSHSVAQVQVDPWSHLDDQTCFSQIDLPPFVEEEFHDFCLFQNDMSTFSDSSMTSWNSSTAESQENVWSEPLEEDIVDVELW